MLIRRSNDHLLLDQLDIFSLEILRLIPTSANPDGNLEAEDRLFSKPESVRGKFSEDWEAYVKPELRHLFQSAITTVESDLKCPVESPGDVGVPHYSLRVPFNHMEAWVSAVNQARLVIATRHRFDTEDLERSLPEFIESPLDMALLQIHIYDFLLLNFLQEME